MSRHRKIDVRMWGDEKFRALTKPQPCGQSLWVHFIAGPQTGSLPGLFRGGVAGLAEELEWSSEAFRKAFAEVSALGMAKADWASRLVWVPNSIRYNVPESPNVVRSWRAQWDELPECDLKRDAYRGLRSFMEGLGEGFLKAFDEAIAKPSPKTMANQEQEQEQEQEQDKENPPLADASSPTSSTALVVAGARSLGKPKPTPEHHTDIAAAYAHWRLSHPQAAPGIKTTSDGFKKAAARLKEGRTFAELLAAIDGMHATPWYVENNQTAFEMAMRPEKFVMFLENNTTPPQQLTPKDRAIRNAYQRAISGAPGMFDGVNDA